MLIDSKNVPIVESSFLWQYKEQLPKFSQLSLPQLIYLILYELLKTNLHIYANLKFIIFFRQKLTNEKEDILDPILQSIKLLKDKSILHFRNSKNEIASLIQVNEINESVYNELKEIRKKRKKKADQTQENNPLNYQEFSEIFKKLRDDLNNIKSAKKQSTEIDKRDRFGNEEQEDTHKKQKLSHDTNPILAKFLHKGDSDSVQQSISDRFAEYDEILKSSWLSINKDKLQQLTSTQLIYLIIYEQFKKGVKVYSTFLNNDFISIALKKINPNVFLNSTYTIIKELRENKLLEFKTSRNDFSELTFVMVLPQSREKFSDEFKEKYPALLSIFEQLMQTLEPKNTPEPLAPKSISAASTSYILSSLDGKDKKQTKVSSINLLLNVPESNEDPIPKKHKINTEQAQTTESNSATNINWNFSSG